MRSPPPRRSGVAGCTPAIWDFSPTVSSSCVAAPKRSSSRTAGNIIRRISSGRSTTWTVCVAGASSRLEPPSPAGAIASCSSLSRAETRRSHALADAIRRRISEAFGLYVDEIVAVPAGSIGRTTSGKLQRAATKSAVRAANVMMRLTVAWRCRFPSTRHDVRRGFECKSSFPHRLPSAWMPLADSSSTLLPTPNASSSPRRARRPTTSPAPSRPPARPPSGCTGSA